MRSGLERVIDRRSREWKLFVPDENAYDASGRQRRDAYFRVSEPATVQVDFRGFDVPLSEMASGQYDIGHVTRGDRHLFVTETGAGNLALFRPGLALVDVFGVRWGIVNVENWTGKVFPGSDHDSAFLRMQITRAALQ